MQLNYHIAPTGIGIIVGRATDAKPIEMPDNWLFIESDTGITYHSTGGVWSANPTGGGGGDMFKADNLSGLADYSIARGNLGLGTLATQNGTFSGTSSGTNTGDNATNTQYSGLAASKQDTLVSATNIKTVNSTTLLGSGDLAVQPVLVSATNIKTINGSTILGSGDLTVGGVDATKLAILNNLSDLNNTTTARTNLGLGSLATQSGTFSGTSSGTNTGDQTTIVGISGTKAQFDTACSDGNFLYVGDQPALSYTSAFCTATTTISAATYADVTGASVSLAAGTWLIMAHIVAAFPNAIIQAFGAITHSDNTVIAESAASRPASGTASLNSPVSMSWQAIVSPGSVTTYKLRAARGLTTHTGSYTIYDGSGYNTANHATNNSDKGTSITAIRLV